MPSCDGIGGIATYAWDARRHVEGNGCHMDTELVRKDLRVKRYCGTVSQDF